MPTECNRDLFGYEAVEGRQVVAAFDGGRITSNAGALLLGAANRAIGLVGRLAGCFADGRAPELVEHRVETAGPRLVGHVVGQRRHLASAGKSHVEPAPGQGCRQAYAEFPRPRSGLSCRSV